MILEGWFGTQGVKSKRCDIWNTCNDKKYMCLEASGINACLHAPLLT